MRECESLYKAHIYIYIGYKNEHNKEKVITSYN